MNFVPIHRNFSRGPVDVSVMVGRFRSRFARLLIGRLIRPPTIRAKSQWTLRHITAQVLEIVGLNLALSQVEIYDESQGDDVDMSGATVFDVARYILEQRGSMSAMKLQKLVYYSQAWSLVWDERPIFPEKIKAYENGPVCGPLFGEHRGRFTVEAKHINSGNVSRLDKDARKTIDAVLKFYGDQTAQWLSDLTHRETPWKTAREKVVPGTKGDPVIPLEAMRDYYKGLTPAQ